MIKIAIETMPIKGGTTGVGLAFDRITGASGHVVGFMDFMVALLIGKLLVTKQLFRNH